MAKDPKIAAVLIDGGHLRHYVQAAGYRYDPDYIEHFVKHCTDGDEELHRVLYYDCAPYSGRTKLPVSGATHEFKGSDAWLRNLASRPFFAVRRGVLKFRGWKPRSIPIAGKPLSDSDFKPDFEQKGVDMRIGLDIAVISGTGTVDRVVLVAADTDFVPAMKHGRRAGIQIVVVKFLGGNLSSDLGAHADLVREIPLPPHPGVPATR